MEDRLEQTANEQERRKSKSQLNFGAEVKLSVKPRMAGMELLKANYILAELTNPKQGDALPLAKKSLADLFRTD